MLKVQEAGSILRVGFAFSNSPHLHRAYLVTICNQKLIAVFLSFQMKYNVNLNPNRNRIHERSKLEHSNLLNKECVFNFELS